MMLTLRLLTAFTHVKSARRRTRCIASASRSSSRAPTWQAARVGGKPAAGA